MPGFVNSLFQRPLNQESLYKSLLFLSSVGTCFANKNETSSDDFVSDMKDFGKAMLVIAALSFLFTACYACCKYIKDGHRDDAEHYHIDSHRRYYGSKC